MSVRPSDIFKLAESLCESGREKDCEASFRSSASRAYYAALHATMDVIPDDLVPTAAELRGKDSHSTIGAAVTKWAGQVRNGRSEARILSRRLPKLKYVRNRADYNISENFSSAQASAAVNDAAEIMQVAAEAKRKVLMAAAT